MIEACLAPVSIFPGGAIFSPPKPKAIPPPPPVPTPAGEFGSEAAIKARQKERTRARGRRGRAASILTGAAGVQNGLGNVKRPGAQSGTELG